MNEVWTCGYNHRCTYCGFSWWAKERATECARPAKCSGDLLVVPYRADLGPHLPTLEKAQENWYVQAV